jgi:hypothetical protein
MSVGAQAFLTMLEEESARLNQYWRKLSG